MIQNLVAALHPPSKQALSSGKASDSGNATDADSRVGWKFHDGKLIYVGGGGGGVFGGSGEDGSDENSCEHCTDGNNAQCTLFCFAKSHFATHAVSIT